VKTVSVEQAVQMGCSAAATRGQFIPVSTNLRYDVQLPGAVVLAIFDGVTWLDWLFGRPLLDDGLRECSGDGDVVVWPEDDFVYVRLSSPTGVCILRAPADEVLRFLERTYAAVTIEDESRLLDAVMEAELYALLAM
jgi:hypothetical protein